VPVANTEILVIQEAETRPYLEKPFHRKGLVEWLKV
jgi:hypothetical protein